VTGTEDDSDPEAAVRSLLAARRTAFRRLLPAGGVSSVLASANARSPVCRSMEPACK
jgi:hypothetical protein